MGKQSVNFTVAVIDRIVKTKTVANTVPVLWLKIVQTVIKSLVQPTLSKTTENTEGKNCFHTVNHSVEKQIKGHAIVPNSVQNPGSSSSAQVKLGRGHVVVSHRTGKNV